MGMNCFRGGFLAEAARWFSTDGDVIPKNEVQTVDLAQKVFISHRRFTREQTQEVKEVEREL